MRINVLLNWADGNTWLGLLLFFVGLGLLVTIHELGHFIAAKSFKVYCSDFSIGFGPKIVKIKRKKGETKFSIGIVPLGGYVSMYADVGDELPDGVNIPKSRSVAGIARWKRYIIFGAGIVMNFVLAYLIFFIACSCFPHYQTYSNVVDFDTTPYTDDQSKLLLFDEEGNEINDLSILDVDNKLNEFFQDGDNYGKYPDAYQLVKHLTKTVDKLKNKGMLISCKNCGRFLSMEEYYEIRDMFVPFNLPISIDDIEPEKIVELTKSDKKMESGHIKFILLKKIGKAFISTDVSDEEMLAAVKEIYFSEEDERA